MRPYVIIPACLLLLVISSCKRDFDCHCVSRGTRTEYIQTVKAENKDEATKDCAAYMGNINEVTLPGVDCEIAEDE
ncbi:MAG: hypothetical protein K0R82_1535 [Flavipsychrobacter sp.]|jgi:hypothetical protein|nr:hypothetical protein [Flavipsychrobacter sp.]